MLVFESNRNVRKAFVRYGENEICPLYVLLPPQHHYWPPLPGLRLVLDRPGLFASYWGLQVMHSGSTFTHRRGARGSAYAHGAIGGTC